MGSFCFTFTPNVHYLSFSLLPHQILIQFAFDHTTGELYTVYSISFSYLYGSQTHNTRSALLIISFLTCIMLDKHCLVNHTLRVGVLTLAVIICAKNHVSTDIVDFISFICIPSLSAHNVCMVQKKEIRTFRCEIFQIYFSSKCSAEKNRQYFTKIKTVCLTV